MPEHEVNPFVVDSTGNVDRSNGAPQPPSVEVITPHVEAKALAQRLIDGKIADVAKKRSRPEGYDGLSDNEKKLALVDTFKTAGFAPEEYLETPQKPQGVYLTSALKVLTEDDREVSVSRFISQEPNDAGEILYECNDPDDPSKTVKVNGSELAKAQLAGEANFISELFKNKSGNETNESQLILWHAEDGDDAPPLAPDEIAAVSAQLEINDKQENDPAYKAAQIIQENLNLLRREINNAPEGTDLTNQNRLIAQLETAQILAGSGFENLATAGALQSLGKDRVPELDELVIALQPGMLEEYNKLAPDLLKAGLNDQQMEILKTQGLNLLGPDGADIIQKLGGMEGLEKFLPEGVSPEQLKAKLEATLTPEQKAWWDTNKDKLGTGAWTALLILLAVPVIAMGATVAAVGTAAGAK